MRAPSVTVGRMTKAPRSLLVTAVGLTLVAALVGCADASTPPGPPRAQQVAATTGRTASAATAAVPVTKLLVFVVENHSLGQMRRGMPWLSKLAGRYGYATRYHAITHPSLPNYLAIAGGSTFGVTDDQPPSAHPIQKPSVFGRTIKAGKTATTYAEGMTSRCELVNDGRYAVRHNPWTYFQSERKLCRQHDVALKRLQADVDAAALPRVGLVVPDVCNDAHDCSLAQADRWMKNKVGMVLNGPEFATGQLAVVITADEDDGQHGNRVLTVVAHPSLDHKVVRRSLTHYSLSRSLAEAAAVKPVGRAGNARSLLTAFGLTLPTA